MTTLPQSLKGKAQAAFNRTAPHPADPRVRLTDDPDDLVAIHCEGVSAVIWRRELPEGIAQGLDEIVDTTNICGHGALSPNFSGLRQGGEGSFHGSNRFRQENLPERICAEMGKLSALFLRVSGRVSEHVSELVNYQYFADPNATFSQTYLPHVDGYVLRLGCIFSKESGMGTQWHPHCTKPDVKFDSDPRSSEEIEAIKNRYGTEQIDTGHVVIFKGHNRQAYPESEHFAHSTKLPKKDVLRLGYFIGYF